MGEQGRDLRFHVSGHILDVVRIVSFPKEQGVGPMGGGALLREEVGVARRDDPVGGQETGVAVIGMQPVAQAGRGVTARSAGRSTSHESRVERAMRRPTPSRRASATWRAKEPGP
jgi:hypothetical protein